MESTQYVVIATSVLHNICRERNLVDVEPEIDVPDYDTDFDFNSVIGTQSDQINERQLLINNYFM